MAKVANKVLTVKEAINKYADVHFPPSSSTVSRIASRELKEVFPAISSEIPAVCSIGNFHVEFDLDTPEEHTEHLKAYINYGIHNCVCHKVAALCFFQWSPEEGRYIISPLIDGQEESRYLVIGEVDSICEQ